MSRVPGSTGQLIQNSWGTVKVWWFPLLVRGKLHLALLPAEFRGETAEGAAILVQRAMCIERALSAGAEATGLVRRPGHRILCRPDGPDHACLSSIPDHTAVHREVVADCAGAGRAAKEELRISHKAA